MDKKRLRHLEDIVNSEGFDNQTTKEIIQLFFNKNDLKWLVEQARKVDQIQNTNKELSSCLEWYIEDNERYEKALEEINQLAIYYDNKGWALNPDKIGKIATKALDE